MGYTFSLGVGNGITRALEGVGPVRNFCRDLKTDFRTDASILAKEHLELMNRTSLKLKLTLMLPATLVATVGCTSKNYVRQQTTPLINKTNELDDMTAK